MALIASITDPIVQLAVDVVKALGLPGVFALMVAESACIPVPSEATMLFAGFNVANGEYPLLAAVAVGSVAWVDGWFKRHGDATVFFARMVPLVRTFISLPAGVARMPFWRFSLFTLAGCIPWVFMLTFIGQQAGDRWDTWKDKLHYVDYAVIAVIVIAVAYLVVRARRRGKTGGDAAPESA